MTIREHAEELGYTQHCRGCGQMTDTGWCGCAAGAPPEEPDERQALDSLSSQLDELSSTAQDTKDFCPEAVTLLDLAWWFAEDALADVEGFHEGQLSCGHKRPKLGAGPRKPYCCNCNHFSELRARAQSIKGRL